MNEQDYNDLRELGWRRKLTPSEGTELQKFLSAHPETRADWQDEAALNELLERLPAAPPVATNFTAQVLQAARLEAAAHERERAKGGFAWHGLSRWVPRAAAAGLVMGLGFAGYHRQQVNARTALANNVVELTKAVSASDPELMQDFEPIRRLSDPQPKADTELLALLK